MNADALHPARGRIIWLISVVLFLAADFCLLLNTERYGESGLTILMVSVLGSSLFAAVSSISAKWTFYSKSLWLAMCAQVISVGCYFFGREGNSDSDIVIFYLMLGLCFPSGLLGAVAIGLIAVVLSAGVVPNSLTWVVVPAVAMAAFGYLQWFVLIPAIVERLKRRFKRA